MLRFPLSALRVTPRVPPPLFAARLLRHPLLCAGRAPHPKPHVNNHSRSQPPYPVFAHLFLCQDRGHSHLGLSSPAKLQPLAGPLGRAVEQAPDRRVRPGTGRPHHGATGGGVGDLPPVLAGPRPCSRPWATAWPWPAVRHRNFCKAGAFPRRIPKYPVTFVLFSPRRSRTSDFPAPPLCTLFFLGLSHRRCPDPKPV